MGLEDIMFLLEGCVRGLGFESISFSPFLKNNVDANILFSMSIVLLLWSWENLDTVL